MASKNIKDWVLGDPRLVSTLTRAERKFLGRKVLNSTLKNAPEGTRISFDGNLHFKDGSVAERAGTGRGKNANYNYITADGKYNPSIRAEKILDQSPKDISKKQLLQSNAKSKIAMTHEPVTNDPSIKNMFHGDRDEAYNRSTLNKQDLAKLKELEAIKDKDRSFLEMSRDHLETDRSGTKYKAGNRLLYTPLGVVLRDKETAKLRARLDEDNRDPMIDKIRRIAGSASVPLSVKYGIDIAGSAKRLQDQYEKVGAGSMLEDVGTSAMSSLASPFSDTSSQWWKDRLNTPTGEAGNVGKNIADEALGGLAGGVVGKGIGTAYKGLRRGGEMYNHRIKNLAKQAENKALNNKNSMTKFKDQEDAKHLEALLDGRNYKRSSLDQKVADKAGEVRQRTYEDLAEVAPRKSYMRALAGEPEVTRRSTIGDTPYSQKLSIIDKIKKGYRNNTIGTHGGNRISDQSTVFEFTSPNRTDPTITRFGEAIGHNVKRKLGDRGMLQKNNDELNTLFEKLGSLDKARKAQRDSWDSIPLDFMNKGAMIGAGAGAI